MQDRIVPSPNCSSLLLSRSDVSGLLDLRECIAAVEDAFRLHAIGEAGQPGVLGVHVEEGGFHIKAAALTLDRPYFAAKLNGNFPHNGPRLGLPTIRGVLALRDAGFDARYMNVGHSGWKAAGGPVKMHL